MALASSRLTQLANSWQEIEPSETVRESAMRFLRVHLLRAADALQLAVAFIAAAGQPAFGDALLAEHPFILVPSAVSSHSWNLIFSVSAAPRLYTFRSEERFALDSGFILRREDRCPRRHGRVYQPKGKLPQQIC